MSAPASVPVFVPTSRHRVSTMLPHTTSISVPEWNADRRLLEAIELLSYLHDRRNYTREGNIYELRDLLINAVDDMLSFNSSHVTNVRFHQMTGRPPWWVPQTLSDISVTFAGEIRPHPQARAEQPARVATPSVSKVIAKSKLEEPCPTECAICQETPKYKDALCTECNHYYCKACWDVWMKTSITCPTCRKSDPKTTIFRMRSSPKPKTSHVK